MTDKTQMDLHAELDAAFKEFLAKCVSIRNDSWCEFPMHEAIEELENQAMEYLDEVESVATRIDAMREYEEAHPEKQYDKYGY